MIERRYKDYDERFAKETVIYVNNTELISNKAFAYKDPNFTEKIFRDELRSIFDEGCIVEIQEGTAFIHCRPTGFGYVPDERVAFLVVFFDGSNNIYSGDSDLDMPE